MVISNGIYKDNKKNIAFLWKLSDFEFGEKIQIDIDCFEENGAINIKNRFLKAETDENYVKT